MSTASHPRMGKVLQKPQTVHQIIHFSLVISLERPKTRIYRIVRIIVPEVQVPQTILTKTVAVAAVLQLLRRMSNDQKLSKWSDLNFGQQVMTTIVPSDYKTACFWHLYRLDWRSIGWRTKRLLVTEILFCFEPSTRSTMSFWFLLVVNNTCW